MNLNFINQLDKTEFISSFENIFEESKFITEIVETKRPFRNKIHIIETFLMIFDNLEKDIKINIIKKHPDLADKVEINKGLSKLSDDEQSKSGLKDCTEDEFNMFQELNYSFKNKVKFNIPQKPVIKTKPVIKITNVHIRKLTNKRHDSNIC